MHNGETKPNLRCNRKALSGLGGLLEIVGLKVMAEGVTININSINDMI